MEISENDLKHLQLQAMLRENKFPSSELMYLGEREDGHWYLVAGEHEVPVSDIVDITPIDDDQSI